MLEAYYSESLELCVRQADKILISQGDDQVNLVIIPENGHNMEHVHHGDAGRYLDTAKSENDETIHDIFSSGVLKYYSY